MRHRHHASFLSFMPWHKVQDSSGCPSDKPWAVVKDDDGSIEGCHATEDDANAQIAALNANEGDSGGATVSEVPFSAVIAVEGYETGDGRMLEVGGWTDGRHMPLPMWVQTEQPEWGGHAGAFIGGRMDSIERLDDGRRLFARGFLSTADDRGQWAEEQVRQKNLRFVSIDIGDADVSYEVREVDAEGWPVDVLARFDQYQIIGATVCGSPAIAFAVIWLDDMEAPAEFTAPLPDTPEPVVEPDVVEGDMPIMLLASARDEAGHPPADWFDNPELDELTHVTVTPDGYVFGHLRSEERRV